MDADFSRGIFGPSAQHAGHSFSHQRWNSHPLQWKQGISTTGLITREVPGPWLFVWGLPASQCEPSALGLLRPLPFIILCFSTQFKLTLLRVFGCCSQYHDFSILSREAFGRGKAIGQGVWEQIWQIWFGFIKYNALCLLQSWRHGERDANNEENGWIGNQPLS